MFESLPFWTSPTLSHPGTSSLAWIASVVSWLACPCLFLGVYHFFCNSQKLFELLIFLKTVLPHFVLHLHWLLSVYFMCQPSVCLRAYANTLASISKVPPPCPTFLPHPTPHLCLLVFMLLAQILLHGNLLDTLDNINFLQLTFTITYNHFP